jgi:hypothetical protein
MNESTHEYRDAYILLYILTWQMNHSWSGALCTVICCFLFFWEKRSIAISFISLVYTKEQRIVTTSIPSLTEKSLPVSFTMKLSLLQYTTSLSGIIFMLLLQLASAVQQVDARQLEVRLRFTSILYTLVSFAVSIVIYDDFTPVTVRINSWPITYFFLVLLEILWSFLRHREMWPLLLLVLLLFISILITTRNSLILLAIMRCA